MSLKLYFHPLSSFCWKVLIALYENGTPFEPHIVDLGNAAAAGEFKKLWPIGKFPVLRDEAMDRTVPESSIIIEYLDQHYPGKTRFLPADPDLARQTRMRDRFFDLYLQLPMQKVVGDRLRPPGRGDAFGVEQAKAQLQTALGMVDGDMATKTWAMGDAFSMGDCAAAHKNAAAYLDRLMAHPSFARTLKEAEPYRHLFPQ
jgi:glutathione S-transferase